MLPFLLVLGAFSTFSAPAAHAQAGAAMAIGVLDEDKLADGYTAYKNATDALDKRTSTLDSNIPAREYLSDVEGKAFDTLIVFPNPTAAQSAQLQALIKVGLDKRATFMGLIGKASKTPKDLTDIKALQEQSAKNQPLLRALSESLLASIRQQVDDTDKLYTDRANATVAAVAGEKKFSFVVRKKALVWSAPAIDITDEVIKRLNAVK